MQHTGRTCAIKMIPQTASMQRRSPAPSAGPCEGSADDPPPFKPRCSRPQFRRCRRRGAGASGPGSTRSPPPTERARLLTHLIQPLGLLSLVARGRRGVRQSAIARSVGAPCRCGSRTPCRSVPPMVMALAEHAQQVSVEDGRCTGPVADGQPGAGQFGSGPAARAVAEAAWRRGAIGPRARRAGPLHICNIDVRPVSFVIWGVGS